MPSTINASNSGSGGLISTGDASGVLQLQTASTAALTIDASQNVGIGVTPSATGSGKALEIGTVGNTLWGIGAADLQISAGTYYNGANKYAVTGSAVSAYELVAGSHRWYYAASGTAGNTATFSESMRINSSGNVGIGTSSPDAQLHVVGQIRSSGSIAQAIYVYGAASVAPYITINQFGVRAWDIGAGTYSSGTFSIQSGGANGVYLGGTATSWASASDERLKDIIEPIDNALTKVNGLRSVIGKYKTDEEGVRRSFLIAQDIQTQFPEALESSDPDKLGVQYTDVIPLLVASIKELKAINDQQAELISGQAATINAQSAALAALTARIVALESRGTV
jgi:trimeric autotransporter adhesin